MQSVQLERCSNAVPLQIDNTDAEGRLILADALCYADTFSPRLVLDIATLTGAMSVALGTAATGVFCTRTADFGALEECGRATGDRVWRMPLWQHYTDKMKVSQLADLNNAPVGGGGACTAAAFLRLLRDGSWCIGVFVFVCLCICIYICVFVFE